MRPVEEIRFLILAAQREGNRNLSQLLAPLNLTPSQAEVLRCLEDAQPLSLNALGRQLICESGSPSRLVSTLVNRGLVDRAEGDDRRSVTLTLTQEGRRLAEAVKHVEDNLYTWIESRIDAGGMRTLIQLLRPLVAATTGGNALAERRGAAKQE